MEELIRRSMIYYAFYAVGFALMLALSLIRCRTYRISRPRAAVYSVITFLSGYCGAWLIGKIYNLLASLKNWYPDIKVDVLGAVIFTSLFLLAAVHAEKFFLRRGKKTAGEGGDVSFRDTMDLMIPGAFLVFACIKIGCMVRGCCWGVECGWGVESPYLHTTVFPVQIFESATLFAIVAVCYYIKQTSFYRRGMAGPLAAFFYGAGRFFWEFFRWYAPETRRFFLGLTLWQVFCVLVLLVAGIWLRVLYKTQPSEPLPKDKIFLRIEKTFGRKKKRPAKKNAKSGGNNAARKGKKKKRRPRR